MTNQKAKKEQAVVVAEKLQPAQVGLFSSDPVEAVEQAQQIIKAISKKCEGERFVSTVKGNKYPRVEWWTTVGAPLSLAPFVIPESVQPIMVDDTFWGYEAVAEIRDLRFDPPKTVTSAKAIVTKDEPNWEKDPPHAMASMAQTRAVSKAYRLALSFLAVLAGLEATPAEEMTGNGKSAPPQKEDPPKTKPKANGKTKAQCELAKRLHDYMTAKTGLESGASKWLEQLTSWEKKKADGSVETVKGRKKFNDLTGKQTEYLWGKIGGDVEKYEKTCAKHGINPEGDE